MITVAVFIASMLVCMVMIPPLKRLAVLFGFVDAPNFRKVHKLPIPRIGGVAIALASMSPLFLWVSLSPTLIGFLLGGGVILIFGVIDDRFDLNFKIKLFGQILAVLLAFFIADVEISKLPFMADDSFLPEIISLPLTVFVVLAVINAVNFTDGLDGLAGGVVLLSLCAIAVLSYEQGQSLIGLIAIAQMGAILGFLHFNSHPAQLFMGDVGSQFLGYSLAVLTILLTQHSEAVLPLSLPLLLVGIPLIDITVVTLSRKLSGSSPFIPDKTHLHHRLMDFGFGHLESVLWIYIFQIVLLVLAYFLRFSSEVLILTVFLLVVVFQVGIYRQYLDPRFDSIRIKVQELSVWGAEKVNYLRRHGGIGKASCIYTTFALTGLYSYVFLTTKEVPTEFLLVSVILLVLLVSVRLFIKNNFSEWLERVAYYLVAMISVYLLYSNGIMTEYPVFLKEFFFVLAVVVMLGMHYSHDARSRIRPLDLLILTIALILPYILDIKGIDREHLYSVYFVLVLFYSIEMLLVLSPYHCGKQKYLKTVFILPLVIFIVTGLMAM